MARFHPDYRDLHTELLARPFPVLTQPAMISHRAILRQPGDETAHATVLANLAQHFQIQIPDSTHGFQLLRLGDIDLRVERHSEFISYTVIAPMREAPFHQRAIDLLPADWEAQLPGEFLAAIEIASERTSLAQVGTPEEMERISAFFNNERLVGGYAVERVGSVWSTFRLDARGCSRFLVQDHRLTPGRFGRLVARLLDIETYRIAALLALPLARTYLPAIEALEARHATLVERIGSADDGDERLLLNELTALAVEAERMQARGESRFELTTAYGRILDQRIDELRETQVPGYQTIGEFFARRMTQALRTIEAASHRLDELGQRIHSSTGLLRTRVEVNLQTQNQRLLASVDRRSAAQLKLQHAVEGLSVVVLTYYLIGLLEHLIEATEPLGLHWNARLIAGLAVIPVALGLWWSVRRLRQTHRFSA